MPDFAEGPAFPCRKCGSTNTHSALTEKGPHFARIDCLDCKTTTWQPKPDDDPTKYKRPAKHQHLVDKFSRGFCELCLRSEIELRKQDSLTGHHVIEYQHGGTDDRENVWIVCTACHRLITWTRTYHGNNHPPEGVSFHAETEFLPDP
jgi:5-methylcytosine-specific restriction endonuclease McrA